jgi:hypothetical protein
VDVSLHFHIDRLTVEGASRAEGWRVSAALSNRLKELGADGMHSRHAHIESWDAGVLPTGASPEAIGHHLATQIFRRVKGPRHG